MHDHENRLCMPAETRKAAAKRLLTAKGHLEGVLRMLEKEDAYCVDVMRQIKAVRGGLEKANEEVLEGHLRNHVATAKARGDENELIRELMDVLKYR